MVKYTEKMLWYTITIIFLVKCLNGVANIYFKKNLFMAPSVVVLGSQI